MFFKNEEYFCIKYVLRKLLLAMRLISVFKTNLGSPFGYAGLVIYPSACLLVCSCYLCTIQCLLKHSFVTLHRLKAALS